MKYGQQSFLGFFCHNIESGWANKINVKKIAFGNKEHTTDMQMGVSVLLRLFISSNEV